MVDFEWYRSFISIYKHNSVSEAAKERMMTQPAMSQHLSALEAEVGQPLFNRISRKMIPTERGKEFYSEIVPLIEALENKTLELKLITSPTCPVIRFGSAIEFFQERIQPILNNEKFRFIAQFGLASELIEALKEDKVDLIVTSKKYHQLGIEFTSLFEEEFVLVAPIDLVIPNFQNKVEMENWLNEQSWLSYGLDLPIIRRFWREYFNKRPQIRPVQIIPNLHALLNSVEMGLGISLIPTYLIESAMNNQKAKMILTNYKIPNELFFAYQAKHKTSPQIIELMKTIKEVCKSRNHLN